MAEISPLGKTRGYARDWRPLDGSRPCIFLECMNESSDRYYLPLCQGHILAVWAAVEGDMREAGISVEGALQIEAEEYQRQEDEKEERRKQKLAEIDGWVYYIKIGDHIKIGHTKDLYQRFARYPPNAEILAYHEGSRADERWMHHKFAAYLATGREWFNDVTEIRQHIAKVIRKHGQPDIKIQRLGPKDSVPVTPRKWRGKRGGYA